MKKKCLIITMLVVSALCFSSLSAYAFHLENTTLTADCNGYSVTGEVKGPYANWIMSNFCIQYTMTITNGTTTITRSGNAAFLVPPGLTNDDKVPFTITGGWGEEICGLDFEATGHIDLYAECRSDLFQVGQDLGPLYFDCPCDYGCTLTFGYWKTHSQYGPAPYDATWEQIQPNGENSNFFLSGKNWHQVLWTSPAGGSAYYILAHQYIAAVLNQKNGATSTTTVNLALATAQNFFAAHFPFSIFVQVYEE